MRGGYDWLNLGGGAVSRPLGDGRELRILPCQAVLEAKREALELEQEGVDGALSANACLVARAVVRAGKPVYPHGRAVLEALGEEEIEGLAAKWAAFDRACDPGLGTGRARVEELKGQLERLPQERLKWKVLRAFGALPTEARVRRMTGRDYLWCALQMLLDQEEEAARLCPGCRAETERERCPVCGRQVSAVACGENAGFDLERYERMRGGSL